MQSVNDEPSYHRGIDRGSNSVAVGPAGSSKVATTSGPSSSQAANDWNLEKFFDSLNMQYSLGNSDDGFKVCNSRRLDICKVRGNGLKHTERTASRYSFAR